MAALLYFDEGEFKNMTIPPTMEDELGNQYIISVEDGMVYIQEITEPV